MNKNKIKLNYVNNNKLEDLKKAKKICKLGIIQFASMGIFFTATSVIMAPNIFVAVTAAYAVIATGISVHMMNNFDTEIKNYKIKCKNNKK